MGQLDTSKRVPAGFQGVGGGSGGGLGCVMGFLREQQMEGEVRGRQILFQGSPGSKGANKDAGSRLPLLNCPPKNLLSGPRQQNQKLGLPDGGTEHVQYGRVYSM